MRRLHSLQHLLPHHLPSIFPNISAPLSPAVPLNISPAFNLKACLLPAPHHPPPSLTGPRGWLATTSLQPWAGTSAGPGLLPWCGRGLPMQEVVCPLPFTISLLPLPPTLPPHPSTHFWQGSHPTPSLPTHHFIHATFCLPARTRDHGFQMPSLQRLPSHSYFHTLQPDLVQAWTGLKDGTTAHVVARPFSCRWFTVCGP